MPETKTCDSCKYLPRPSSSEPCNTCILNHARENETPCWEPIERTPSARLQEPLGPTGFVRDAHAGKGRMDLLPWIGIMEVSKLCEEGAEHYGERNIDKGAPLHSLLDSGARHIAKLMSGYTEEDHLRAACWNLLWAL